MVASDRSSNVLGRTDHQVQEVDQDQYALPVWKIDEIHPIVGCVSLWKPVLDPQVQCRAVRLLSLETHRPSNEIDHMSRNCRERETAEENIYIWDKTSKNN
jgi:hypothetical protein